MISFLFLTSFLETNIDFDSKQVKQFAQVVKFVQICLFLTLIVFLTNPSNIYLLKVNNRHSRESCEICSKLAVKTPERRQ